MNIFLKRKKENQGKRKKEKQHVVYTTLILCTVNVLHLQFIYGEHHI
jgi:hypothetical protein